MRDWSIDRDIGKPMENRRITLDTYVAQANLFVYASWAIRRRSVPRSACRGAYTGKNGVLHDGLPRSSLDAIPQEVYAFCC